MHNILYIMMDQLRYDALGFQGKFPVPTPNIDRLAANGTVFQNAYTANPVCVPARASLMTGRLSFDHGVYYNDQNWPRRMDTYAQRLADNGYYTCVVGKTHFHPPGLTAGFQKMVLGDSRLADLKRRGLHRPARKGNVHESASINDPTWYPNDPTHLSLEDYSTVYYTDRALHELDLIHARRECGADGNEPYLLKLSYTQPHSPCDPPEPYFSMIQPDDLPPPARTPDEIERFPRQLRKWYDVYKQLDETRAQKHRAQYFGDVALLDEQIGRVLAKLEELGTLDNTLVILTSDHGDYLCDHYIQQKAFLHDCSARVPLIFCGPGIPAGRTVNENVSHVDIFPTLMDYCRLAMPPRRDEAGTYIYPDMEATDAVSLIPYFGDSTTLHPRRVVLSENAVFGYHFMMKQGDLKVNYYVNRDRDNEFEVFDLDTDPDELDNRGGSFTPDDLTDDMRAAFDRVLRESSRHQGRHYYFQGKVRPLLT